MSPQKPTEEELLTRIGQELRAPLAPILATLQSMRQQGTPAFAKERELIERNAQHLGRMLDALLDQARLAEGKVELRREPLDLAALMSKAVDDVGPYLKERGASLGVEVPRGIVVDGDEGRLVQVVFHLLMNAVKYTARGGLIEVMGGRDSSAALLRVRDTGIGIAGDVMPRVFDRFWQGPASGDASPGGLGLGLPIARSLVELHGGTLTAFSEGPGKGSELTLRLPLSRTKHPARKAPGAAEAKAEGAKSSQEILVVEDHRGTADVLAMLLRARGHTVEVAHHGAEALDVVRNFRPRFALLDIGLPSMDGYELARRLRRQKGLDDLVLIAVTGYGQPSDRKRSRSAGFSEHLVKPIDVDRLFEIVESERS